jgi:hypothetical protein
MIERQKRQINVVCNDGVSINAFIYVLGEQRLLDVMNNAQDKFVLLIEAEIAQQEDLHPFKLAAKVTEKRESLILNKSAIKWIAEI